MDQDNPYIILNLPYDANSSMIKSAYKKLALKHHPDVNHDDGQKFLKIKNAYEILIDPKKRKLIDIELLNSHNLINLKNNTIDYLQLLTILNKLELEVENPSVSSINKELLGEYLLWLFDEHRIYNVILSHHEDELNIIISQAMGLIKHAHHIQRLDFYNHMLHLNAHFNKILISNQIIYRLISQVRQEITYNKYKLIILLLTSIVVCFIIFFTSK